MARKVFSGMRCCPKCGGDHFFKAECGEERSGQGGFSLDCLNCEWQGFGIQLVKKPVVVENNENGD